jgi:hypothetical protein
MNNDLNAWLSDFFAQYPGLTAEQRAVVQEYTYDEQAAIDAEVESILLASL